MAMRSNGNDSDGTPSCPCCAFLPDNLFLPSSVTTLRLYDPDEIKSTCSSKNYVDGAPAVPSPSEAWELLLRQSAEREEGTIIVDTHGHPQLERAADNGIYDGSGACSGSRRVDAGLA